MITAGAARGVAREWVRRHAAGARGAFVMGSAAARGADEVLPATSDVDVTVVVDGPRVPPRTGLFRRDGVLLDVGFVTAADLEASARSWVFAPGLAAGHVLADADGRLTALSRAVAARFAEPAEVARRVDDVAAAVRDRLRPPDPARPWPEQVIAWPFPTTLLTHVPLVAALRTPTVRLRYVAARPVTPPDLYRALLADLGCADVRPDAVAHHLDVLDGLLGATAVERPAAIDGGRELVARGDHREAVFWLVATLARAAERDPAADAALRAAAADLVGVRTPADLTRRRTGTLVLLDRLRDAGTPGVREDDPASTGGGGGI
ncbi:hypothetical protein GCM10017691_00450 [Pseudonocardia petroleophila]|uniref:Nucleotidyltransferase domain-containing protein n=1 Tax=Pseudonocardia petroleophila TaxID=37331 RepID=A0A7G7MLI7_9PSEU|nr:hypothetical protein [Pseudonocardia petroleophila]QNG53648.1 hypothetical protein H6H00_06780 [Pseudonocardia petroleophila]